MSEPQPNQTPNFRRFADWCLHKDSLSTEARHTVEVLLAKAGTSDCYEAEQILSNSTELILYKQGISDLSPLSSLTNLTVLHLFERNILNLNFLSSLTNLTKFYFSNKNKNPVDLNPLCDLTKLTVLHLVHSKISDLISLSRLINLTVLNLERNQISDLSPLSELKNLTVLHLDRNQIYDLTPISGLTNLTTLNLLSNKVSDISPISQLTNLTRFDIASNKVSDLSPISELINLTELLLNDNQISDLSPISGLTNLNRLYLNCNQISDLSLLFGLTNLNSLVIRPPIFDRSIWSSLQSKCSNIYTVPIDEQESIKAVKDIYAYMGLEEPKIIFLPSLSVNLKCLPERQELEKGIAERIEQITGKKLSRGLRCFLYNQIQNRLTQNSFSREVWRLFHKQLEDYDLRILGQSTIMPEELLTMIGSTEFLVRELNYQLDEEEQEALRCLNQLFENCGWIFTFEKVCIVCDRPRKISLDTENRLHAEGEPVIVFSDGWHTGYYYHGVKLPEKYGKLHPHEWQAQWLLEEDNAELRRVLIQAIGYDRICEQLQAQVIDSWQEYTLLRIDADVDVEPIHLLKMTCPSTAKIHTLRVPPQINSARVAVRWVNWDIDPEEFSVQT